jgi:hypothetical protein
MSAKQFQNRPAPFRRWQFAGILPVLREAWPHKLPSCFHCLSNTLVNTAVEFAG